MKFFTGDFPKNVLCKCDIRENWRSVGRALLKGAIFYPYFIHIFSDTGLKIGTDDLPVLLTKVFEFHQPRRRECHIYINFVIAPCINNIRHFIVQLMHTNYKIIRLLK